MSFPCRYASKVSIQQMVGQNACMYYLYLQIIDDD